MVFRSRAGKLRSVTIADLMGNAIRRIAGEESVSVLF